MTKPVILTKKKLIKEAGCCFRSCGGKPCIMNSDSRITSKQKILKKIDKIA